MKAKTLLTVAITLSAFAGYSQAREVEMPMGKEKGQALRIEVNEPASKVDKAIQTQLAQTGAKRTKGKSKGVYQYKGVKLSPSMGDSLNVYTKVESKGKNNSVVYFAAARPNGEFINEQSDSASANQLKSYLYDFIGTNNLTSLDYDIYKISDSVQMDETNNTKYQEDRKKLEQQRDEISKQLTEMENTYNQSKTEAEGRKQRMQEMQSRKGSTGSPVSSSSSKNGATGAAAAGASSSSNGATGNSQSSSANQQSATTGNPSSANENSSSSSNQSNTNSSANQSNANQSNANMNSSDTSHHGTKTKSSSKSKSGKTSTTKSGSKSQSVPDSTQRQ